MYDLCRKFELHSYWQKPNKKTNSDLKYDILGWVILAVGIVTQVGMGKSQAPLPPPLGRLGIEYTGQF